YNVTVGGTAIVSGVAVTDGDNSLYFESTAGTVSIAKSGVALCSITTTFFPSGEAGSPYSQIPQTANCVPPVAWDLASGALCGGLTLDAAMGTIFGIPTTAQTCTFGVRVTDSTTESATQSFSIQIQPAVSRLPAISGGGVRVSK